MATLSVPYVKVLGNVHFIDTGGWTPGAAFRSWSLRPSGPCSGRRRLTQQRIGATDEQRLGLHPSPRGASIPPMGSP